MKTLYLYTTLGCHLCEQAQALAWPLLGTYGLRLQSVEIADDPQLLERYGVRIPVLAVVGDEEGLGWPFDAAALEAYLAAHC
ncbi:glutaredoxin family protein [Pseudomaricurvus sp. HS19]|uniref:glutaredoxin family protein n=1 Tax=Pseudomaricurvus sp. HS19 TaxID=2692626 RepID=UPI00136E2AC6|nr:glutaredoxin family protein [Pseudomaricurvus sp. HS19]MYM62117.1 glutaredoxin family protein [Pseudomaricurvus sp. HS19]